MADLLSQDVFVISRALIDHGVSPDHSELQGYSNKHNATKAKLVGETSQLAIISSKTKVIDFDKDPSSMKGMKSAGFLCSKNHYDYFTLTGLFYFLLVIFYSLPLESNSCI